MSEKHLRAFAEGAAFGLKCVAGLLAFAVIAETALTIQEIRCIAGQNHKLLARLGASIDAVNHPVGPAAEAETSTETQAPPVGGE